MDVVEFATKILGLELNNYQVKLLQTMQNNPDACLYLYPRARAHSIGKTMYAYLLYKYLENEDELE